MTATNKPVYINDPNNGLIWMRSCEKETIKPVEGKVKGEATHIG